MFAMRVVLTRIMSQILSIGGEEIRESQLEIVEDKNMVSVCEFDVDGSDWGILDDRVMGGRSRGTWKTAKGLGVFAGELSLENNGGFSLVRSALLKGSCIGAEAFRIRVRGDGRTYQLRVRANGALDGVNFQAMFPTSPDAWQEIILPLSEFKPTFRGRILADYPPLDGGKVVTVVFLLADKKPGAFRLDIDWLRTMSEQGQALVKTESLV